MIGLYAPHLLRHYVIEQLQITDGAWYEKLKAGLIPAATTKGPGGRMYYTEPQVVTVLDFWRNWWRYGRGSRDRDTTLDPFNGMGTVK